MKPWFRLFLGPEAPLRHGGIECYQREGDSYMLRAKREASFRYGTEGRRPPVWAYEHGMLAPYYSPDDKLG